MQFTYQLKEDDIEYQLELLKYFNIDNYELLTDKMTELYNQISNFEKIKNIINVLKCHKHFFYFNDEMIYMLLFNYDYLYIAGPLFQKLINQEPCEIEYELLMNKLK